VPFTLVHAGKYTTEDKLNEGNAQAKHNPEKANNTKQQNKYPGLVASYDTRPENKVG